jgi:hypothetical protein
MNKKIVAALLVAVLLLVGGWIVYSRFARRREPPPAASNWPSAPAEPSNPPAGAGEHPSSAPPKEAPSAAAPVFVLRQGETLHFDANIAKLNSTVARLKIVAAEKRSLGGRPSWHLQAFAHTENPYRMVFELDDQFDSYSDAGSMVSRQYEMHLSERGQKVDTVERMLPSAQDSPPPGVSGPRAARHPRSVGHAELFARRRLGCHKRSAEPGLRRKKTLRRAGETSGQVRSRNGSGG